MAHPHGRKWLLTPGSGTAPLIRGALWTITRHWDGGSETRPFGTGAQHFATGSGGRKAAHPPLPGQKRFFPAPAPPRRLQRRPCERWSGWNCFGRRCAPRGAAPAVPRPDGMGNSPARRDEYSPSKRPRKGLRNPPAVSKVFDQPFRQGHFSANEILAKNGFHGRGIASTPSRRKGPICSGWPEVLAEDRPFRQQPLHRQLFPGRKKPPR